jgi:RNA polymerase sigma-70 factor, ECF subfamily
MPRRSSFDKLDDAELIAICNDGDATEATQAFNTLYVRHKDYVVRVASRYVRSRELALDVLQETFLYLLGRFPPGGPGFELTAKMTTFLYPVAKNFAITQQRKAARFEASQDPDELAALAPPPSDDLGRLLDGLPDERREVLLLRFVDGLSLAEIAEVLGIPLGTVKSRLHLAIRSLKKSKTISDLYLS